MSRFVNSFTTASENDSRSVPQLKKSYFLHISVVSFRVILLKSSFKNPQRAFGNFSFKYIQLSRSKLEKKIFSKEKFLISSTILSTLSFSSPLLGFSSILIDLFFLFFLLTPCLDLVLSHLILTCKKNNQHLNLIFHQI